MRTRSWSIRRKIVALLLVPLVSLVVLWLVATSVTLSSALGLMAARKYHEYARLPADELVSQLQQERKVSVVYLGARRAGPKPLADQRTRTDAALATLRRRTSSEEFTDAANDLTRRRLRELSAALETLSAARETIDRGELDRAGAMRLYTRMIDAAYRLFLPLADLEDRELARQGRAVVALGRARDALCQEDALLAGVAAAGRFDGTDHSQLVQAIGMQRARYEEAAAELLEANRVGYQSLMKAEAAVRLRALEDKVVAEGRVGAPVPVEMAEWRSAYDMVAGRLRDIELAAGIAAAENAEPIANRNFARLWLASVLGLVAVVASVLLSLWLGTSLVTRLSRLRGAAAYLAQSGLPGVVARLRRGEYVNVRAEAPLLPVSDDEIGQVSHAFNEAQRTAVQAAVAEARLRQGLNDVFRTIAERSQDLLHRQLALLDGMERRLTEPADLEDLLRVDHLATRMRRQAEDLAVLAGAVPGRGWHNPVPMIDVIRGAVSEVEDYARVTVLAVADVGLVGRAVGDTIHLLAELIENGASVSPPHTQVQVSGDLVPNGFVIEVEDRGTGLTTEAIADANRRLAEPPEFDPATSTRLGLFVVAKLAARHGTQVHLRPSAYGGITAVVLVPPELVVVDPDEPPAEPAPAGRADAAAPAVGPAVERGPVERGPAERGPAERGPAEATELGRSAPNAPLPRRSRRPTAAPARQPAAPAAMPGPGPGLPRRIPQASLTPQLTDPPPESSSEDLPASPAVSRSPEQERAALSAFQAGTIRGRRESTVSDSDVVPSSARAPGGEAVLDAGRDGT